MPKRLSLIIRNHHNALKILQKSRGKHLETIMNNTPSIVKAIKTLFKYILNNTLKMSQKHIKKLKIHRQFIRKIAHGTHKAIKPAIQKGGSIFTTILSTVLPLLTAII